MISNHYLSSKFNRQNSNIASLKDANNNVIIVGSQSTGMASSNIIIQKYDYLGNLAWVNQTFQTYNSNFRNICIDKECNIYLTANLNSIGPDRKVYDSRSNKYFQIPVGANSVLAKFNSSGEMINLIAFNGSQLIGVDNSLNIYINDGKIIRVYSQENHELYSLENCEFSKLEIDYNNILIAYKNNYIYLLNTKTGKILNNFKVDSLIKILPYKSDIYYLEKNGLFKFSKGEKSQILQTTSSNFDLYDDYNFILFNNDSIIKFNLKTKEILNFVYSGSYFLDGIFYIDPSNYIMTGTIGIDGNICAPPLNLKPNRFGINNNNTFFLKGNFINEPYIISEEILKENKTPINDIYIDENNSTFLLKFSTFNCKIDPTDLTLQLYLEDKAVCSLATTYSQNYLTFTLPKKLKSGIYTLNFNVRNNSAIKLTGISVSIINKNFLNEKLDLSNPLLSNQNHLHSNKILFLSANPIETSQLNLEKEKNEIKDVLNSNFTSVFFKFFSFDSVKPSNMVEEMIKLEPTILHFSGHGSESGIILLDEKLHANFIEGKRLADFFSNFKDLQLVVLNACYSQKQAKEIKKYVPYVIGMNAPISDNSAITFSKLFYIALSNGFTIEESFLKAKAGVNFVKTDSGEMITLLK